MEEQSDEEPSFMRYTIDRHAQSCSGIRDTHPHLLKGASLNFKGDI